MKRIGQAAFVITVLVAFAGGFLLSRPVTGQGGTHVVYFVGTASSLPPAALTPSNVQQWFTSEGYQYTEADTWQEVLDAHASSPIAALIIDNGSFQSVDQTWVRDHYRTGMVIAAINEGAYSIQRIIQDPAFGEAAAGTADWGGTEFYTIAYNRITGTNAALTAVAVNPTAAASGDLSETLPDEDEYNRVYGGGESTTALEYSATAGPPFYDVTTMYELIRDALNAVASL